jgi:hypothetical protein
MLKISVEALSPYQSLIGFRFHRGIEVLDDDQRVGIVEFQFGLCFFYIGFTWYVPASEEED